MKARLAQEARSHEWEKGDRSSYLWNSPEMDLNQILTFVRVAEAGSFTGAAARLGLPKSTVSRKVAELEGRLGVSLLRRTTRQLSLTEAGEAYLRTCSAAVRVLQEAELAARTAQETPQGTLRVTAVADFARAYLGRFLDRYLSKHPEVRAEVFVTDRLVDLVAEGFDLAIRMGELDDSNLKSRRIGSSDLGLYAAPSFLKRHPELSHPRDLQRVDCLRFTAISEENTWRLRNSRGHEEDFRVLTRFSSNHLPLIQDRAESGAGLALLPEYTCRKALASGRLVRVLPAWWSPGGPIHIVFPEQRFVPPKLRAFLAVLDEELTEKR